MTSSRLRIGSALALASVVMAGCGGGDADDKTTKPADPAKLARSFTAATGVQLSRDGLTSSWSTLRSSGSGGDARFGNFSIYVVRDDSARRVFLGEDPKAGADGVIAGTQGRAFKDYGNGILVAQRGSYGGDDDPAAATRLDHAMQATLKEDPTLIPEGERSCEPGSAAAGTCWLEDTLLTAVDAGSALSTPVLGARVSGVRVARELPARTEYSEPERAKGRFLIVRYRVTNRTNAPIQSLRPNLVIGENTYTESTASYSLTAYDQRPFPLQPDDTTTVTTAFDIPEAAAEAAVERGQLELPAALSDGSSFLSDREAVGRIGLAGAPRLELGSI